jgi:hypothetical protein
MKLPRDVSGSDAVKAFKRLARYQSSVTETH